jgi:hypothetical protein
VHLAANSLHREAQNRNWHFILKITCFIDFQTENQSSELQAPGTCFHKNEIEMWQLKPA